jgi:hypothetical protein
MVLVEHGAIHNLAQVLLIAFGEEEQGLCIAVGRVQQALAVGVLANALEYRPHGAGQLGQPLLLLLFRRLLSLAGALALGRLALHATGAGEHTRPAQPVEVDRRLLRVRALGAACTQRRLHDRALVVSLDIDFAVCYVVAVASVCIRARCALGEVAIRSAAVQVHGLAAAVRRLDGGEQTVPLFLVARLGGDAQRRGAISQVRGDGLRSEGRR